MTTEEFIEKAKIVHGDKYDYSKVNYTTSNNNIVIICTKHGEFIQRASHHLRGVGCSKCAGNFKSNTENFIKKSKIKHGDKYDYSKVNYINNNSKVTIICPDHGEFKQRPTNHLRGDGCPKCGGSEKSNTEKFIEKSKMIHGNKYDYSKVNYINRKTNVNIICPKHGEFEQTPNVHLRGSNCPYCSGVKVPTSEEFIINAIKIHGDKYDYSKVNYKGAKNKIIINCPEHGDFKINPTNHIYNKQGCSKCVCRNLTINEMIIKFNEKSKEQHGDRYDYSLVEYKGNNIKIKIICPSHGIFEQTPYKHSNGNGCPFCGGKIKSNNEDFIEKSKTVHGNKFDYSKVNYINARTDVIIICPEHGEFKQRPTNHIDGKQGCPTCNYGFTKSYKLSLLSNLEDADLLYLDPIELQIIIDSGKLPTDFGVLVNSKSGSDDRIKTLNELKKKFEKEDENEPDEIDPNNNINPEIEPEIVPIDDVDIEITSETGEKKENDKLPIINTFNDFHILDNSLYTAMDEESFNSLVQYRLRLLWNKVLNSEITIDSISKEVGGKYFTMIKDMFFDEYNVISKYTPPTGYNFKVKGIFTNPNLMQKLTVHRLLKNKSYGNWSGTGAGKTLSFIIASREIDSKLTIVIALNSTIEQTSKSILDVYPDSKIYTKYHKGMIFDRNKHNYLILNYEKFQQNNSEELFQDLTNNNKIDFVVIDEVHNAKQREEENESIRRGVLLRLMGRIREKNQDLYTLAMSATPVINNILEAKSLLILLTGLDYDDVKDRKTISNAISMFQLLTLKGLRFIPKYDINIQELTGHNMSNLNIDGSYLIDQLVKTTSKKYIEVEKLLLPDKLASIANTIKKGDIVYSYYTTGFINEISQFVENLGFKIGTYTGEESLRLREENLKKFKSGEIDILIGSKPIGTGVDGLQETCNTMYIITLPWTDGEYTQLKGRIYRQGSIFDNVNIVIPQVKIDLGNNEFWSWDVQRLNLIKNKKTLADAVVDGVLPSKILPSLETMHKKAIEALKQWKDRVGAGNIIEINRKKINIELYPEIDDEEQRRKRIDSELSEFNRKGKTTLSSTMHKTFTDDPDSWFRYHALRKERMSKWDEIPYEYIATKIKNKKHIVVDFGCGENKMKERLPNNQVISFDHVSIDDSVIACDMKDVSQYLENESVDIAVFSLALWGTNYRDYLKESYRVLNYGGFIYIAEPSKDYEGVEGQNELKTLITDAGFKLVGDIENRGKFIYIIGTKN